MNLRECAPAHSRTEPGRLISIEQGRALLAAHPVRRLSGILLLYGAAHKKNPFLPDFSDLLYKFYKFTCTFKTAYKKSVIHSFTYPPLVMPSTD